MRNAFKRTAWGLAAAALLGAPGARAEIVLEGIKAIQQVESVTGVRPVTPRPKDAPDDKESGVDPAYAHTLRFMNGDVLHGNLVGIDPQRGLRWRTPDAKAEIEFRADKLARVVIPRSAPAATNAPESCVVTLSNGDELVGAIASLDAERLSLQTDYAGTLNLPRKRLQSIRMIKAGSNAIFEGPTSLEGWTSRATRSNWRYRDNSLIAVRNGSIGRDVKLPAMARLEFDLAWNGQLQFLCGMFTDGFEEYGSNSYLLQMQSGYIYMQRVKRNSGQNHMGNAEVPGLQQKSKVHVEILANKEARTIALVIDGALVKQWRDNMEWVSSGTGLLLCNQGMGTLKVSNIRVTEWDGTIQDQNATPGKTKQDTVEMSNKDKVSGTLQQIKEGKMIFATAFANMEVPVERIRNIDFASENLELAEKKDSDVRAVFAGRGAVTVTLEKWDGQQMAASSSNFGQAKFVAGAFSQLHFNWELQQQQKKMGGGEMVGSDDGEITE